MVNSVLRSINLSLFYCRHSSGLRLLLASADVLVFVQPLLEGLRRVSLRLVDHGTHAFRPHGKRSRNTSS